MANTRYSERFPPVFPEHIDAFADDQNPDDSDADRVLFGLGSNAEPAVDGPTSCLDTKVVHGPLRATFVVAPFGLLWLHPWSAAALYVVVAAVIGKAIGVTVAQAVAVALGGVTVLLAILLIAGVYIWRAD